MRLRFISHLFKNSHKIPTKPMGIQHSFHTHPIPIPVGIFIPTASGVFRGGMVRWLPPLARPWKFVTGDIIWKSAFFAVFQQISEKNGRICGFQWTFKSKKCFSFRGASPPWPTDQGLCFWTPLGAPPPDPRYRLALCALAMAPPLPSPKYATVHGSLTDMV